MPAGNQSTQTLINRVKTSNGKLPMSYSLNSLKGYIREVIEGHTRTLDYSYSSDKPIGSLVRVTVFMSSKSNARSTIAPGERNS